jgi:hypothetical protein
VPLFGRERPAVRAIFGALQAPAEDA